jgi:(4S)-4-hydroxy-5-phosphonooxypentane-2,3-dione isomerase
MVIVHVYCRVEPEHVEAFRQASLENARDSLKEPGVARFDLIQEVEDPTRFALLEVYRTEADPPRHKETAHYAKWRDTVESLLAEPRRRTRYVNVAPADPGWETPGA